MGNEKFTWVIKNFSSLKSKCIRSDEFVIGGCKWVLEAYPNGCQNAKYFSLYLVVAASKTLPCGWKIRTKFSLTVVNQLSHRLSQRRETERWFDQKIPCHGSIEMISLTKLSAKKGGFLVNNEVKIVVEVDVLQAICEFDVSEVFQEVTQPLKRIKLNVHGASVKESIDVNGFQVLPSQAESVKLIFERHPDMALEFLAKNQHLRTSCINVLLSLIETLCQSLQDISSDDLIQTEKALTYLEDSGFKVDWLERKVEEINEKKMEELIGKSQIQELEEELKDCKYDCYLKEDLLEKQKKELKNLKQYCSDIEALLEEEKTKVLAAARAPPLTLDDVV